MASATKSPALCKHSMKPSRETKTLTNNLNVLIPKHLPRPVYESYLHVICHASREAFAEEALNILFFCGVFPNVLSLENCLTSVCIGLVTVLI